MDELEAGQVNRQICPNARLSSTNYFAHVNQAKLTGMSSSMLLAIVLAATVPSSMVENAKNQARETGVACVLPSSLRYPAQASSHDVQDDAEFTSYSDGFGQDRRLFIALKTV